MGKVSVGNVMEGRKEGRRKGGMQGMRVVEWRCELKDWKVSGWIQAEHQVGGDVVEVSA